MQINQTRSFEAYDDIDNTLERHNESCVLNSSTSLLDEGVMDNQSENTFQNDNYEKHTLMNQLKVTNDMVVAALVCYDDTHRIIEDLYRKARVEKNQRSMEGDSYVADLQMVKVALESMKSEYLYLLSDRDHILKVAEVYANKLKEKEDEVNKLIKKLIDTHETFENTQIAYQEAKNQISVTN